MAAGHHAKVTAVMSGISTGASVHRMDGDVERLRYLETRLYAAADVPSWRFSIDAINQNYDQEYNGVRNSYFGERDSPLCLQRGIGVQLQC